jgi:mannobiose 2-epimerase
MLIQQMQFAAKDLLIDRYYPTVVDTVYGGYLSTLSFDLKPTGAQEKSVTIEARHLWSTSKAYQFYKSEAYLSMARHGFLFMKDKLWDKEYGGFYGMADRHGNITNNTKDLFGNSYALFGLAAYYGASHDAEALALIKKLVAWMEQYAYDAANKGYYSSLQRDNKRIIRLPGTADNSPQGYKDQNSTVHILEAFTELYTVWPDPLVKKRLQEMLKLVRDRVVHPQGYVQFYFKNDWAPVSYRDSSDAAIMKYRNIDHVSFGHDIETAFLLLDASRVLGYYQYKQTKKVAKWMVDQTLRYGWDKENGGLFDEGNYMHGAATPVVTKSTKSWWPQAECMNCLLIMADLFPNDEINYERYYRSTWQYIKTYLLDYNYGDWYQGGLDKEPQQKERPKASIWKGTYHTFRALSNCINRMKN